MSSGFHRLGANAGKVPGFSNKSIGSGAGPVHPIVDVVDVLAQHNVEGPRSSDTAPSMDATLLESEQRPLPAVGAAAARQAGYTGDQCDTCNSMRMKISGHCMVCEDCGTTTGCS